MSAQITVNVAGDERSVPEQTTAADLFGDDRSVLVARVNGELRDLAHVLDEGDVVDPVTAQEQDGLDVLRHSAAHVLAQAVQVAREVGERSAQLAELGFQARTRDDDLAGLRDQTVEQLGADAHGLARDRAARARPHLVP